MTKIYFAGPSVFMPNVEETNRLIRSECKKHGFTPLIPTDNNANFQQPPEKIANDIATMNYAAIDACDMVIAEISPFRGPSMDPGTAAEIGYARARGRTIILWTQTDALLRERVARITPLKDCSGTLFEKDTNIIVENFGLSENLMIAAPAVHAGPVLRSIKEAVAFAATLS